MKCDIAHGDYLSEPIPEEGFSELADRKTNQILMAVNQLKLHLKQPQNKSDKL